MPKRKDIKRIIIIGSGPIVIGQACEFDYSGTQAFKALKDEGYIVILVNSNPQDVASLIGFGKATYKKMIQNLIWATGYNVFAIPLAAGTLISLGILITPAIGAIFMSLSTVIVAINARFLKIKK